jgi:hypothetical protein
MDKANLTYLSKYIFYAALLTCSVPLILLQGCEIPCMFPVQAMVDGTKYGLERE